MKIKFKTLFIWAVLFFSALISSEFSYGQDSEMEQALKNYETYKQAQQDKLAARFSLSLEDATETWLNPVKLDKKDKLRTRLKQNWEKLSIIYPISPAHYEYYLIGYDYNVIKSDIVKTDSITCPYKATVVVKEELYVEKYHSPDISDVNPYFYTVTTNHTLYFVYKQNKFELVNCDSETVDMKNEVPVQMKKQRL